MKRKNNLTTNIENVSKKAKKVEVNKDIFWCPYNPAANKTKQVQNILNDISPFAELAKQKNEFMVGLVKAFSEWNIDTSLRASPFFTDNVLESVYNLDGKCLFYISILAVKTCEDFLKCCAFLSSIEWSEKYLRCFDVIVGPRLKKRFLELVPETYSVDKKVTNNLFEFIKPFNNVWANDEVAKFVSLFSEKNIYLYNSTFEFEEWLICNNSDTSKFVYTNSENGKLKIAFPIAQNVYVTDDVLRLYPDHPFLKYYISSVNTFTQQKMLHCISNITIDPNFEPKLKNVPINPVITNFNGFYKMNPYFCNHYDLYRLAQKHGIALPTLRSVFMNVSATSALIKLGSSWMEKDEYGNTMLHDFVMDILSYTNKPFYDAVDFQRILSGPYENLRVNRTAILLVLNGVRNCCFDVTATNNSNLTPFDLFLPVFFMSFSHFVPNKLRETDEKWKIQETELLYINIFNTSYLLVDIFSLLLHPKIRFNVEYLNQLTELTYVQVGYMMFYNLKVGKNSDLVETIPKTYIQNARLVYKLFDMLHEWTNPSESPLPRPYTYEQTISHYLENCMISSRLAINFRMIGDVFFQKMTNKSQGSNKLDLIVQTYVKNKMIREYSTPATKLAIASGTHDTDQIFSNFVYFTTKKYRIFMDNLFDYLYFPIKSGLSSLMMGMTLRNGLHYLTRIQSNPSSTTEICEIYNLCPKPKSFREKVWQCQDLRKAILSYL